MRIDHSQKKLLITLVLAVGVFVSLGWYPASRDIESLSVEIDQTQKQLLGAASKTEDHASLYEQVRRMREELAATSKVIPQQDELAGLIREVSTRIGAQNLGDQALSTKAAVDGDRYVTMPISIQCKGDSLSVFRFLNELEQMPQLVQVTGLFMGIDERSPGAVKTEVTVNTYFYTDREQGRNR